MAATLTNSTPSLLFKWAPRRRRKRSIVSFIVASVILHAAAFYLVQIVYPPTVIPAPPPGRVSVISSANPEGRQLLRWVEAEDPALAGMTQRPPDAKMFQPPRISHAPTYVGHQPELRHLPAYAPDLRVPTAHPPGPVLAPHSSGTPVAARAPTTIAFSPELNELGEPVLPEMRFTRGSRESPDAAMFRVAANTAGEVRFVMIEQASGDAVLDEQARRVIALSRFRSNSNAVSSGVDQLRWGTATVRWGNDINPPETSPPTVKQP